MSGTRTSYTVTFPRSYREIRSGWAASCPTIRMAAHGRTKEIADENLNRTLVRFLRPFQRIGVLAEEIERLGLTVREQGNDLRVALIDAWRESNHDDDRLHPTGAEA